MTILAAWPANICPHVWVYRPDHAGKNIGEGSVILMVALTAALLAMLLVLFAQNV